MKNEILYIYHLKVNIINDENKILKDSFNTYNFFIIFLFINDFFCIIKINSHIYKFKKEDFLIKRRERKKKYI